MPAPSSRMTKNRAQPARYRPGKAEVEEAQSEDDTSDEEEQQEAAKAPPPKATSFPSQSHKLAVTSDRADQTASTNSIRPPKPPDDDLEGFVTASESSEEEEEGQEEDDSSDGQDEGSSESEEESSSDDEPKKPMLAPKFISKAKRSQQAVGENGSTDRAAAEDERVRKEKADELLQAQLERDAATRAAGKKYWDDDDIAVEDEVDDADGIDPEAEHAAWKLRELKRVRRDRLAIEEKEKEREEIERRRNMTAEEREEEDKAFIEAQKEDKEGRGKLGYMQKYFHKGAYFGDDVEQDEEVRNALNRDFAGAKFADDAGDKTILPEYMRMRDMTRLGKKGRTKYKDLKNEDTGRWGDEVTRKKRDFDGLDDRFRSDDQRNGGSERTGANNAPVGERRRREDDESRDGFDKRARHG